MAQNGEDKLRMTINVNETNIDRRIHQFIKHSKSGYIKQSEERYIIFENGSVIECRFDDMDTSREVFRAFAGLEEGILELSVESEQKISSTKPSIPYLKDYLVIKEDFTYIAGNAELEKTTKKLINNLDSDLLNKLKWELESFFISAKDNKIGLFMIKGHYIMAIFDERATLSLIKRKIGKLIQ